jgi:hypothetical protein
MIQEPQNVCLNLSIPVNRKIINGTGIIYPVYRYHIPGDLWYGIPAVIHVRYSSSIPSL